MVGTSAERVFKVAFTQQIFVGQLTLACVNDTTTCWPTVGNK